MNNANLSPCSPYPSRSVVHSTRGIVACTHPLAAKAGIQILESGGNAADAAVAVAAALGVVEPAMTGLGGDVFALFYDAATGQVRGLNGSGYSPSGATRLDACHTVRGLVSMSGEIKEAVAAISTVPPSSAYALTIPGAPAAWVETVEQYGSKKVSLRDILAPAIALAEKGFPVSKFSAYYWARNEERLLDSEDSHGYELLKPDPNAPKGRRAPREGEMMFCPELAKTLRALAADGKKGFYCGRVGEAMWDAAKQNGSPPDWLHHALTLDGTASMETEAMSIELTFQKTADLPQPAPSIRLWEHPPNGQGVVALMTIGLLQAMEKMGKIAPLHTAEHNSGPYLHILINALAIAFADAAWFIGDPDARDEDGRPFDPNRLIDPAYLEQRVALFNPSHAPSMPNHGQPPKAHKPDAVSADELATSDTVYLAVTDQDGNGCSFVNSVGDQFGSGVVPAGTGFALGNRGKLFRLGPPNHLNVYGPQKRPYNTIVPAIVTEQGPDDPVPRLHTVLGVMGGFMQPQGHVQVLLNMHLFGADPQAALDAPRVCLGINNVPSVNLPLVYVEDSMPDASVEYLKALKYGVRRLSSFDRTMFGRGQVIRVQHDPVTQQRVYAAGSDCRGDGHAVPY